MKTFYLWMLVLSAQDGTLLDSKPVGEPLSIEECVKAREGRISVAKDGRVEVYLCERIADKVTRI